MKVSPLSFTLSLPRLNRNQQLKEEALSQGVSNGAGVLPWSSTLADVVVSLGLLPFGGSARGLCWSSQCVTRKGSVS